jgi:Chain length determinant protein
MDSGHLVRGTTSAIREVPPTGPFEFGPPLQPWLPSQESALREYFRVLIKRKWTVIGCLVTIFSLVAIASFKMTPIYEAVGRIAINKPDSNLVNFKDSQNGGGRLLRPHRHGYRGHHPAERSARSSGDQVPESRQAS